MDLSNRFEQPITPTAQHLSRPCTCRQGNYRVSIKVRLILLIGTSLLTALIVSLVSYLGNIRMAEAVSDNEVSMTALRKPLPHDR